MKVRIGIAPPPDESAGEFAGTVDRAETLGIDSLWLSEILFGPSVEPFVGMAYCRSAGEPAATWSGGTSPRA